MFLTRSLSPVHAVLLLVLPIIQGIPCPTNKYGFERCDCLWDDKAHTISEVNCTNTNFKTHDVLGILLKQVSHVRAVTFTGNNIPELQPNLFGTCPSATLSLDKLTYLDLSNNSINIIHGQTLHCAPNLEVVILSDNQWQVESKKSRVFSSLPFLRELHLDNAFSHQQRLDDSHIVHLKNVFTYSTMWAVEELRMERNGIVFMDSSLFCNLPNLQRLYLSHNNLNKIDLECLETLRELYFEYNNLTNVGPWMQASIKNLTSLEHLSLYGNPFQCTDCPGSRHTAAFRDWLHTPESSVVVGKELFICQGPKEKTQGKFLYNITDHELLQTCPAPPKDEGGNNKEVATIAAGMVVLSLLLVAIIVVIINRDKIRKYQGGWCDPLRDGARNVLKNNVHFGYSTMTEEEHEEEMCNMTESA